MLGKAKGFTNSHLMLVNLGDMIEVAPAKYLEKAGILVSDDFSGGAPEVRIGTPEVTRRGFKEEDMDKIAYLFKRLLIDKEDPELVALDVEKLARQFTGIDFTF